MYIARLVTPNFHFHAYSTTASRAHDLMRRGWEAHRQQFGEGVDTWDAVADDVHVYEFDIDTCIRDGSTVLVDERPNALLQEALALLAESEQLGLTFDIGRASIRRAYIDQQEDLRGRIRALRTKVGG